MVRIYDIPDNTFESSEEDEDEEEEDDEEDEKGESIQHKMTCKTYFAFDTLHLPVTRMKSVSVTVVRLYVRVLSFSVSV